MPPSPRGADSTTSTATRSRELAGPALGKLPERRGLRHGGRRPPGRAGGRARAAARDPGGHRGRRPPVRGARIGCVRGVPHGQLGHHGQRVGAGARATGALAGGRGGDAGRHRGVAAGGGLSAAGSFLAWLGRLLGRPVDELAARAADSPLGARGVIAVPWLDGARAPWWRDDARAGFVGLGRGPRRRRPVPGRDRVGGLGRAALHGGGDGGTPGGEHRPGGHARGGRHRASRCGWRC